MRETDLWMRSETMKVGWKGISAGKGISIWFGDESGYL